MSAAEKLKALLAETTQEWPEGQAGSECIDCSTPVPSVAVLLMPALPQIVAVVEAAQAIVQAEDDWDVYAKTPALDAALAALDDKLASDR